MGGSRSARGEGVDWPRVKALSIALVVTALTIEIHLEPEGDGLDASWITALHLAADTGANFGSQITFILGPLGFIYYPALYYTWTGFVGVLALVAIYVFTFYVVAAGLQRRLGTLLAAILTVALAAFGTELLRAPELLEGAFAVLCAGLILSESPVRRRVLAGLGTLAAATALIKISAGALVFTMLVVTVVVAAARERPDRGAALRLVVAGIGSFLVALIALWLLTRQSLFDLPDYVKQARQMVDGYTDAALTEQPGLKWQYAPALVGAALTLWLAARAGRGLQRESRVGLLVLYALFLWVTFRHGFVRHDLAHAQSFFALGLVALTALMAPGRMMLAGLAAVVLTIGAMAERRWTGPATFTTASAVQVIDTLGSSSTRHFVTNRSRTRLRTAYGLTPSVLDRLRDQTVHVDPQESAVAWAYPEIRWRPVPMFQSYTAYTHELDDLNADFLESSRAPEYILKEPLAADARNPRFESPDYTVRLLCRYRQVASTVRYQVLRRGADRCLPARAAGGRSARFGEAVAVPAGAADELVVARFTNVDEPLRDDIGRLVFKARQLFIGTTRARAWEFVPGHAAGMHVMRVPGCLGYDRKFDSSPYPTVTIARGGDRAVSPGRAQSGSYEVEFLRIPFRCGRRG